MKQVLAVKDKLAVTIIKQENITDAGILLPENVITEPQLTCQVVSKGLDSTNEISVGDYIYCHRSAGMDIIVDGIIMKILNPIIFN